MARPLKPGQKAPASGQGEDGMINVNDVSEAIREELRDEIADLEEYAARGERPPHCRGYRIRVNRDRFVIHEANPTREMILETAGLTPVDQWSLRFVVRGCKPELIKPDERVDLRGPGVEKFKALPLDQTEGENVITASI